MDSIIPVDTPFPFNFTHTTKQKRVQLCLCVQGGPSEMRSNVYWYLAVTRTTVIEPSVPLCVYLLGDERIR